MTNAEVAAGEAGTTPLAIELANTWVVVRGRPYDGIETAAGLRAWLAAEALDAARAPAQPDAAEVADFRRLRDAVRSLADSAAQALPADPAGVAVLNEMAARAPRWPSVEPVDGGQGGQYTVVERSEASGTAAALAAIARDAMALFFGPRAADVRACQGPGCVQFFVKDHPRREWCSPACGNRARSARHYRKQRDSVTDA